jgi:myo-inositol-1(or 4)-monophosphatase
MEAERAEVADALAGGLEKRWLDACRRMVAAMRKEFAAAPGIEERTVYEGVGEGGDRSLRLDLRAEEIVFAELERLHTAGLDFRAVSEERGEVAFGEGSGMVVVIDPIDGSLNARRTIPAYSLSIALASGPSVSDVELGFVHDFGAEEEFTARRGGGARLGDAAIEARGPGYGLEVVGIEAAKPERVLPVARELSGKAFRLRSVGSIAITVCWVAAGRFDGMLTTRMCRSVDVAAAALIAAEAGALIDLPPNGVDGADLGLDARYHVLAALDAEGLETLRGAQQAVGAAAA